MRKYDSLSYNHSDYLSFFCGVGLICNSSITTALFFSRGLGGRFYLVDTRDNTEENGQNGIFSQIQMGAVEPSNFEQIVEEIISQVKAGNHNFAGWKDVLAALPKEARSLYQKATPALKKKIYKRLKKIYWGNHSKVWNIELWRLRYENNISQMLQAAKTGVLKEIMYKMT